MQNTSTTTPQKYQYLTVLVKQRFSYHPTYRCDQSTPIEVGQRVKVKLRGRECTAFVLSIADDCALDKVLDIESVLDPQSTVSKELMTLFKWVSQYYHTPLNTVLFCFLPGYLLRTSTLPTTQHWHIIEGTDSNQIPARAKKQWQLYEALTQGITDEVALNQRLGAGWRSAAKALQEKQLVEMKPLTLFDEQLKQHSGEHFSLPFKQSLTLNSEQENAVNTLCKPFNETLAYYPYMLFGVTGSGKTEVFFRVMEAAIAQNKQVLYLVPEIALTEQTSQRIAAHFKQQSIVFFHSAVSEKEKCLNWFAARNGQADIIVGTRSAVLIEAPRLGLIVIDEEHDLSYKQQDSFAYNARDVANMRAKRADIPIILASATPSLETYHNALQGRYHTLTLQHRAAAQQLPHIELSDMRSQRPDSVIGHHLKQAIAHSLEAQQQVLIFLNRRGFAPIMLCNHCGWSAHCQACERPMTYHRHPPRAICHHCETTQAINDACPQCGHHELTSIGVGTQRLEDYCTTHFPNVPVIRIDRDSTKHKGSLNNLLTEVHQGTPCILVGTQMLAKGHDFQHVNLVGVVDVDQALLSIDYRAHEHLAQLMTQVAGRAGRNENSSNAKVLIQTRMPEHPLLQQIQRQDYAEMAMTLLYSRELYQLPPYTYQCLIRAQSTQQNQNLSVLQRLISPYSTDLVASQRHVSTGTEQPVSAFGPLPSQYAKTAGVFSAFALLTCSDRITLHRSVQSLNQKISAQNGHKIRITIEIDPVYF